MQNILMVAVWLLLVVLSGCRGCTEQLDPTGDWKKFKKERILANEKHPTLEQDGSIPVVSNDEVGEASGSSSIDGKYNTFCSSCHGVDGDGKGPAGMALKPPPRDFVTWTDPSITDDYIAKVISEGGAAVGKSALMAPWGGVLSADELKQMVEKVRSFQKK